MPAFQLFNIHTLYFLYQHYRIAPLWLSFLCLQSIVRTSILGKLTLGLLAWHHRSLGYFAPLVSKMLQQINSCIKEGFLLCGVFLMQFSAILQHKHFLLCMFLWKNFYRVNCFKETGSDLNTSTIDLYWKLIW